MLDPNLIKIKLRQISTLTQEINELIQAQSLKNNLIKVAFVNDMVIVEEYNHINNKFLPVCIAPSDKESWERDINLAWSQMYLALKAMRRRLGVVVKYQTLDDFDPLVLKDEELSPATAEKRRAILDYIQSEGIELELLFTHEAEELGDKYASHIDGGTR